MRKVIDPMIKKIGMMMLFLGSLVGLFGCMGQTGTAQMIRQYVLEYQPPFNGKRILVGATVRVERFSANRLYAGLTMLFRDGAYRREAFSEHRWRIAPADMIVELLRRDIREAGLFLAVLSPRDIGEVRYSLEGELEEFLEDRAGEVRKACIAMTLTFLDLSRQGSTGFVMMQKTYRAESPINPKGAAGLAAAMSLAMSNLSQQVITDMEAVLKLEGGSCVQGSI